MRCPACSRELPEGSESCSHCGASVRSSSVLSMHGMDEGEEASERTAPRPPSSRIDAGRFAAGTVLGERYRIVGRLGEGGMGDVYPADDLVLEEPVALKFLRAELTGDARLLGRFRREVRLARAVTHPNVCRVHDLGEVEGTAFLSMEYVDGEDLASLLHRVGRLTHDKALDLARQLCAGLAAAHAKGVLHRDLKPANVMVDGRGRARITDFGLAVAAGDDDGALAHAGTPAYMAPEQLASGEVGEKSDLYSLGLVLYELFTGERAHPTDDPAELRRRHAAAKTKPPSAVRPSIDRVVERTIQQCLETNPARRPASVLAVAVALPGGDPLAAALAAGETPSPELVAAAGELGTMPRRAAIALALAILALLAVFTWLNPRCKDFGRSELPLAPEVLAHRAGELREALGFDDVSRDRAFGFAADRDVLHHLAREDAAPGRWDRLGADRPSHLYFWYRESPAPLARTTGSGRILPGTPPIRSPGEVGVWLSPAGRLLCFAAPPSAEEAGDAVDWEEVFTLADLDPGAFRSDSPHLPPSLSCDERLVWTGVFPEDPEIPLTVVGESWEGRLVLFQLLGPDEWALGTEPVGASGTTTSYHWAELLVAAIALLAGIFLARRNLARGWGDPRAATRIALWLLVLEMLAWLLRTHHVSHTFVEFDNFRRALGSALYHAVFAWVCYLALEPYLRRLWPDRMVAWNRLLSGRRRDPLVGRSVLVGILVALVSAVLGLLQYLAGGWWGGACGPPGATHFYACDDLAAAFAELLGVVPVVVVPTMGMLLVLVVTRSVLRSRWLALLPFAVLAIIMGPDDLPAGIPAVDWGVRAVYALLLVYLMAAHGVLALVAAFVTYLLLSFFPVGLELASWSVVPSTLPIVVVVVALGFGLRTACPRLLAS